MEPGKVWGVTGRAGCPLWQRLRCVSLMRCCRPRNCWSSRSTRWLSTTGALVPWLSSASRASGLFSPTGSLCSGERPQPWGVGGRGDWESLLKEGVCPFALSCHFTCSHLTGRSQARPEPSVICLPEIKSCWDPTCRQFKLQRPRKLEQLSSVNIIKYNTIQMAFVPPFSSSKSIHSQAVV